MKISIVSGTSPLKRHLELEGYEVEETESNPIVFAGLALGSMGYTEGREAPYVVQRYFKKKWHKQTLVGIPLDFLMNGDLGPQALVGFASRYVVSPKIVELLENEALTVALAESGYEGFVHIGFDLDGNVLHIKACPHELGLYAALEGCPKGIGEFIAKPMETRLLESWAVALLVSRYPFPHADKAVRVTLEGLSPKIEEHFWSWNLARWKRSWSTEGTKIGIATGWGQKLYEACDRSLRTCRAIRCIGMQYRTDTHEIISHKWEELKLRGWV